MEKYTEARRAKNNKILGIGEELCLMWKNGDKQQVRNRLLGMPQGDALAAVTYMCAASFPEDMHSIAAYMRAAVK